MLIPTLVGMVSMVVLNITDGAFVGHGVGGEALAAVNIAAPVFNIMTAIGLMFGTGSSVSASILLSRGKTKAARIHITQSMMAAVIVTIGIQMAMLLNLEGTCRLFGGSDSLVEPAAEYLKWIVLFLPLNMVGMVGEFIVRLDGSPRYAMACTLVAATLNILLDWLFIFPFGWGLRGAAIATALSFSVSALMSLTYILFFSRTIHFSRFSLLKKSTDEDELLMANLFHQIKMGFPAFLGEMAVTCTIIVGNFVFTRYLGDAGVAAYSVACYCMPIGFMLGNSITQSSQPIISFAYGTGNRPRTARAQRVSVMSALIGGLLGTSLLLLGTPLVTRIFISSDESAFSLTMQGLPLFSLSFLFLIVNLALIGCLQSVEQSARANLFMLLRGFIFVVPCFVVLPRVWGITGIWLAIPVTEALTTFCIAFYMIIHRKSLKH